MERITEALKENLLQSASSFQIQVAEIAEAYPGRLQAVMAAKETSPKS